MFKKILIATDFSPTSECLIQYAGAMKALGLEHAILAHVVHVPSPSVDEMLETKLQPELDRQKRAMEMFGITVDTIMRSGVPAEELNLLANEQDVDAVFVGSRGRGLAKSLLGSVSYRLLHLVVRPIFLLRDNAQGEGAPCQASGIFQKILFSTGLSDTPERAFAFVEEIAKRLSPEIVLLHVREPFNHQIMTDEDRIYFDGLGKNANDRLEALKQRLSNTGSTVNAELVVGSPSDEIVKRTRDGATLLVIGNHGKGFIREIFMSSVANQVVRKAGAPVLLIPELG